MSLSRYNIYIYIYKNQQLLFFYENICFALFVYKCLSTLQDTRNFDDFVNVNETFINIQ